MLRRFAIAAVCLPAALLGPASAHADIGSWSPAGALSAPRGGAEAAVLPGGSVLVAGGIYGTTDFTSAERYDPGSNTWSALAPMSTPRAGAPAIALADGRVLIPGGRIDVYDATNTAEVFDPATGKWSATGSMHTARGYHAGIRLRDGRVLVVGGDGIYAPSQGAEIWDPATGAWTPTGPVVTPRFEPGIALLGDGRVLVVGGWNGDELSSAELYDPATDTWTQTAPMSEPRDQPGVAVLPDGRVLVAGGYSFDDLHPAVSQTSEIYDPRTGTWTPAAKLNTPRGEGLAMSTLADGRPVISGGFRWIDVHLDDHGMWTWSQDRYENTAEVFDPASGTWTQSPPMRYGRAAHIAVPLADDSLLVAGGYFAPTDAERLRLGTTPSPTPTATPTATPSATPSPAPSADQRPPAQPVLPKPTASPSLTALSRSLSVSRAGRIAVRLRCTGPSACADTLVLRLRDGGAVLATAKARVTAGRTATITLALKRPAMRRLTHVRTKVTLQLTAQHRSLAATLRRPR